MAQFDINRAKAKLNQPSAASLVRPFSSVNLLQDTKSFPTQTKQEVPFEATKAGVAVNTVKGLPTAAFDVAKAIARGTARGAVATGTYAAARATGQTPEQAREAKFVPDTPVKKFIFGKEPVSVKSEGQEPLQSFGVSEEKAKTFAAPAVISMTALDLFTGPGKRKLAQETASLVKLSKEAKNSLENSTTGVRDSSLAFLRQNPEEISKGEVRIRELEDGSLFIEDGRHRLQAALETGVKPNVVDVTKEYTGKPSTKVAQIISDVPAGAKERGFVTSVKEKVPEASKVAGQYVPRSTDELAIKAANLVKDDPVTAERIATTETGENAVAIASELIKKYTIDAESAVDDLSRNNAYDKVAEVANSIAEKLTEQGRAIQAASILGRMTPEGQLRFAAREIQKYNQTNPTRRIPELTGEQTARISSEMKAINAMPDGDEKAMRFFKLQKEIQDLVPTPLWKKVTTAWKAGLLTGLKTTGLNLFSNLSHALTEVAKDIPAVAVDSAASLFTGKRTKTLTLRNAFDGIKEGAVKGKRYFSTGFDEREIGQKLDYTRVNFGKGVVAKAFQTYTDTVFRAIGSSDQPFYYAALSRSMMDQALAQGKNAGLKGKELVDYAYKLVENPTEEMIRYGVADATTVVFQNKTALGQAASGIQRQLGPVGQIILPFAQTPSAVAMQIISYSPLGAAKTLFENVGKGKFDQRLFSQGMGRSIMGTAFLALGYKLFEKGLISLDFPKGDEAEQELQKAEGQKANSVLVKFPWEDKPKWRSPMVLGPAGNLILMGGHFGKALEDAGSPSEAAAVAAAGVWKSFMEQTFLTGVSNFAQVLQDPQQYAGSYLPNLVASGVPTIVSDVARATDPLERKAQSGLSTEGFKERVQARIPGARQGLEPDIDVLGRERQSVGNPLEILADPTRPSPQDRTLVTGELRRLMDLDYRVSPTKLGDRSGYDVLTPEQNTKLWKQAGEITNEKLNSLFSLSKYQRLPDDQKAKVVESVVDKSQNYARAALVVELTQELRGEELKTKLKELKEGGLLTRDVYRAYQEIN